MFCLYDVSDVNDIGVWIKCFAVYWITFFSYIINV